MLNQFKQQVEFNILNDIEDVHIESSQLQLSWDQIVELFSDFTCTEDKRQVGAFIPATFKPQSQWLANKHDNVRIDDNIQNITMAVLDLDKPGSLEKAKETFQDFEYLIHSTHSYTSDSPHKHRMIIQLDTPVPADQWKPLFYQMVCPIDADTACSNFSRGYYLPSYAPDAGVEPYFEHNEGKALTIEAIQELGRQFEKRLKKEASEESAQVLNQFKAKIREKPEFEGKRHPSGGIVKNNVTHSSVDCSYQGYKKRYEHLIKEHLERNDNRHNFAMTVVYNELKKHRESVDMPSMVLFINRAAQEHSSKALHMGNTPQELPHLIESAYHRIGNIAKPLNQFLDHINAASLRAKTQAIQVASTGDKSHWRFPEKPIAIGQKAKTPLETDFQAMKAQFHTDVIDYLNTGDWQAFSQSVLGDESVRNSPKQSYHAARFALWVMDQAHRTTFKKPISEDALTQHKQALVEKVAGEDSAFKKSILIGMNSFEPEMKALKKQASPVNAPA